MAAGECRLASSASQTVLMTPLQLGRTSVHREWCSPMGGGRGDPWALPADAPSSTRDRVSPGTGRLSAASARMGPHCGPFVRFKENSQLDHPEQSLSKLWWLGSHSHGRKEDRP